MKKKKLRDSEGGTIMDFTRRDFINGKSKEELIGKIGFSCPVEVDLKKHKKILITGANSYIGNSFIKYANENYKENFTIEELDLQDEHWKEKDFSKYDIVYHVAGIAHADVGKVSNEIKEKYYKVNTDLAIDVCKKCKNDKVKKFIFMSSMIVYGESAPCGKKKVIDKNTIPVPANFYGDSKLQADVAIRALADDKFKVIVLRPPMIYGNGSKGNYSTLSKFAKKLPFFPNVKNERSMLYIENFTEFLCQLMLIESPDNSVVLIPQNKEWSNTALLVKYISKINNKNIFLSELFNIGIIIVSKVPGKLKQLINKAFGNNCYDLNLSNYEGMDYQKYNLLQSISFTEKNFKTLKKLNDFRYSVLMSVYKNDISEYLSKSIDSMINQSLPPSQIVIVKDGFIPKDIEKTLNEYQQKNPQLFTIVELEKNSGLGAALNYGIKFCKYELIARMDSDDISLLNRCEMEIEKFKTIPNLAVLGAQIREFMNDEKNIVSSRIVPSTYYDIYNFSKRRSPFNHPTVMYRKSVIQEMSGYQEIGRKEDLELFLRIINSNYYVSNLDEFLLLYRTSEDNLKRRRTWKNCKEYIQVMFKFYLQKNIKNIDMLYVLFGQLFMFIMPIQIVKKISQKFLRKK